MRNHLIRSGSLFCLAILALFSLFTTDLQAASPPQFVYVANAGSNTVSAYTMDATTGALTPVAGSPFAADNPFGVAADPSGKFVYVANVGSTDVSAYTINAASGALTPVPGSPFAGGSNLVLGAVDPSGKFLYVTTDVSTHVFAYSIDATTGALTPVPGSPFAAGSPTFGVAVDPSGKFVYVTNAGSNNVSAYTIDATSGALTPVPGSPFAAGTTPVGVAVDSSGKFVYVTNFNSVNVSAYSIDTSSGALTPVPGSPFAAGTNPGGVAVTPACVPPPAGLVSWWPLDGKDVEVNNNIALDIAGPNQGTLQGGATFAAGRVGQAILLDGIDDFVDAGNDPSLQVSSGDFTVDTWVRFNALGGFQAIVDKFSPTSGIAQDGWALLLPGGFGYRFWFCLGGVDRSHCSPPDTDFTLVSATSAEIGRWYHLAVVKNSTSFSLYVNGQMEDTRSPVPAFLDTNSANLLIGADPAGIFHLNGEVDEVEIFNRALSAQEILDIFTAGASGKCHPPPLADAGDDQTVDCTSPAGTPVMLDGSGSSDVDGDDLTYMWTGPFSEDGGTATSVSPTVTLPLGTSTITLVVNDGTLDSEPDTVDITVKVAVVGLQPPLLPLVPEGDAVLLPDKAFKRGRTLPLKLELFCGGMELTDGDVDRPLIVGLVRDGNALDIDTVDLDSGQANDSGLAFRYSDGNWVYNLSTAGLSTGTYSITIQMPDGLRYDAAFVLK